MTLLGSSDLIAFLTTREPTWARDFYEHVLGLRFVADEPQALVFDANGTMLRIAKVQHFTPVHHTVLGWGVSDLRRTITELKRKGVVFERHKDFAQDDLGIWTAPNGAKVAWFRDPDGNMLSLTQFEGGAA